LDQPILHIQTKANTLKTPSLPAQRGNPSFQATAAATITVPSLAVGFALAMTNRAVLSTALRASNDGSGALSMPLT
jgi:hypothetical protein